MQIGINVGSRQSYFPQGTSLDFGDCIRTQKKGDRYEVSYRGVWPVKLLPYRISLLLALGAYAAYYTSPGDPVREMAALVICGLLLLVTAYGYFLYGPYAGFSGTVAFQPKDCEADYVSKLFGITISSGRIKWEDRLRVDKQEVGLTKGPFPLGVHKFYVVTQFMNYHVATFGPNQGFLAEHFAKALAKARKGRAPEEPAS